MINGDSAWNKRHGNGHFPGPRWRFGCRVSFMPTPSKLKELPKGSPRMMVGLLVGYTIQPGGEWKGEFAIVPLTSFTSLSLAHDASHPRTYPQTIKEAKMLDKTFVFPLKATYEEHNGTLEGAKRASALSGDTPSATPQGTPFDVPDDKVADEPSEGSAHSGVTPVLAKTTLVEEKQEAITVTPTDADAPLVESGGSTSDEGGEARDSMQGGSRRKSTRPPYIDSAWWKSMQWVDRKMISKQYIEMCAED